MLTGLLTRLEQASKLDRVGDRIQQIVQSTLRSRKVRDLLHGVWLGHPLHATMVVLPLGSWISATTLDFLPGRTLPGQQRAATTLTALGTASALPAALAGINDWASLSREQRRVGLIHATANLIGVLLFTRSLSARLRGRYDRGRTLSLLGLTVASTGAYLGGHLAYRQGAAVNQGTPELHHITEGWHPVADLASLPEEQLVCRTINDVPVVAFRDGDKVSVLLDHCAHQSGPLSQGKVVRVDGHACVVCPWHGSTYQLDNGEVVHGPAASDQQMLPTRIVGNMVEARLP